MNTSTDTPTFSEIAAHLVEHGYRPVPIKKGQKRPAPDAWPTYTYERDDDIAFRGCYTGIITKHAPAVDIDVLDEALSSELKELALRLLGAAPERVGRAPKTLLLYRTATPFAKMKIEFRLPNDPKEDKPHGVEILGDGQQFVAYAVHPDTGRPYSWSGPEPLETYADALTEVTSDGVIAYLKQALEIIEKAGARDVKLHGAIKPKAKKASAETNEFVATSETLADVADALEYVPGAERDAWLRVGMALHHATQGGDEGFALFDSWSSTHPGYEGTEDCRKTWDSLGKNIDGKNPVTIASIFKQASENGWARKAKVKLEDTVPTDRKLPKDSFPFTKLVPVGPAKLGATKIEIIAHVENVAHVLKSYGYSSYYDEIRYEVVWMKDGVPLEGQRRAEFEADLLSLCNLNDLNLGAAAFSKFLAGLAVRNPRNLVVEYLETLPAWDGVDRYTELVKRADPADPTTAHVAFRRWLIQACASIDLGKRGIAARTGRSAQETHAVFEGVLVFPGGQGDGKTKGIVELVPKPLRDYVVKGAMLNTSDKDSVRKVVGAWICELGELDATFRKSDIAAIKAFLSQDDDRMRLPYDRDLTTMKRRTTFCGSVNDQQFLRDHSGNRRYYVVPVTTMRVGFTPEELDQLWAQAWSEYVAGEQWWPTGEEQIMLNAASEEARELSPAEEELLKIFDWGRAAESDDKRYTVTEIHKYIRGTGPLFGRPVSDSSSWNGFPPSASEAAALRSALTALWRIAGVKDAYTAGGKNRGWLVPPLANPAKADVQPALKAVGA